MYEKPLFDGPKFFQTKCLTCYGSGTTPRWGMLVRARDFLFRDWRRKPCEACHGRGQLSYVITRENDLVLASSWEYTNDGFPWVSTYNFNGRQMTWDQLDEQQNAEPVDWSEGIEGHDFVFDEKGRKVDFFTGEPIEPDTKPRPPDLKLV